MENLKKINDNLDKLVFDDEPLYMENIYLENVLCDTILSVGCPLNLNIKKDEEIYNTKCKLSLEETINICKKFLQGINPNYVKMLDDLLDNNIIKFIKTNDVHQTSFADFTCEISSINVYLHSNINDVFTIIHEFMHYTNSRYEKATEVTSYYTEVFSNFIELLLVDYIIKNYPKYEKDALKIKRSIFISIYEANIDTKIILELIKKKINGCSISKYDIFELIKNINSLCPHLDLIELSLEEMLSSLIEDAEDAYIKTIRNTIGIVLGSYMYELSKDKHLFKEIFELNDNLEEFYYDEVFTYLGLNIDSNFNLTEDSMKKLVKSYKTQIKELW